MLFFTILTLTNLNAQEKQNDATWEETIEFINKNKGFLSCYQEPFGYHFNCNIKDIQINENTLKVRYQYIKSNEKSMSEKEQWFEVKLHKISRVDKLNNKNIIRFFTTGKNIHFKSEYFIDHDKKVYFFPVEDTEMFPRLLKAFKQLAYLATKKREEVRKNSGDKF